MQNVVHWRFSLLQTSSLGLGFSGAVDENWKYGCSVFVDVARFLSVVQGIDQVNTRRRFESVVNGFSLEQQKREAWVSAFEFLQMMRLRIQLDEGVAAPHVSDQPDLVNYDILDNIDKRILKECFRVGRKLQQRIESEYLSWIPCLSINQLQSRFGKVI